MIKSVLDSQAEDHVHVIRWENCEVSGWTELDQFDGSEPVRQDLSFDARQTGSAQASFGWIIVVMRKLDNNPDIAYDVNVHGQFITMESDDSQVRRAIEPVRGKVQLAARNSESMLRPHPIVRSNQFAVALQKDKTGYPVSWLELRVVPSS